MKNISSLSFAKDILCGVMSFFAAFCQLLL